MNKRLRVVVIGIMILSVLSVSALYAAAGAQDVQIIFRDIKLYVGNALFTPKDANGAVVEPFIYNGSTYVPLRAVSEALGKEVGWDDPTSTVTISDGGTAAIGAKPIGIMSAMDSELALLLDTADISRKDTYGGFEYHIGRLEGQDVVLVRAGVGKSLAAACAAVLINRYEVSALIFTGIAGGVGDEVKVLDMVISTDLIQHDFGRVTADGFSWTNWGGVGTESGRIPVDAGLRDKAYAAAVSVVGKDSAFLGTVVTGDQFIMSDPYVTELQEKFNALACEMEGAAVARVAYEFETPCVVVRCMSDKADGLAHEVIEDFGDKAADISASIVIEMMKNY